MENQTLIKEEPAHVDKQSAGSKMMGDQKSHMSQSKMFTVCKGQSKVVIHGGAELTWREENEDVEWELDGRPVYGPLDALDSLFPNRLKAYTKLWTASAIHEVVAAQLYCSEIRFEREGE